MRLEKSIPRSRIAEKLVFTKARFIPRDAIFELRGVGKFDAVIAVWLRVFFILECSQPLCTRPLWIFDTVRLGENT